jgi:DNA-binding transcriptional MerR regulator
MKLAVSTTGAGTVRTYSSREVVRITGITPRQLQWWDEQGIVTPLREGRNRCYSFADLTELRVIAELRRKSFSLQGIRKVMRFLKRELGRRLADVVAKGGEYHVLTDGKSIYLRDSAQGVVDVLKNAQQAMFAVCLSDTVRLLQADLADHDAPATTKKERLLDEKKHPTSTGVRQHRAAS